MEIETVRKLATDIALAHPKEADSEELRVIRQLALILLHIAEDVHKLQQSR